MEPGRILASRYEIVAPIAAGAMSAVWEARDRESGERVAVKAVSLEKTGWNAEVRDRFQREASLLSLARHEHLVGVHAIGETDDGYLYIVLDKLSGETLADRLGRPPRLSWREAARIALELADGLTALHSRGIVHRDLKPANVILHVEGSRTVSKIIDLGISKAGAASMDPGLFATLTATGQVLGTPAYMSYEQATGQRDVDARSDVWALGVVLFEMLMRRRPFDGANANAVLASIRRVDPSKLGAGSRVGPPALWQVIERCLARNRDTRYKNGGEVFAALEAAARAGNQEESRTRWRKVASAALVVGVLAATTPFLARLRVPGDHHSPPTPASARLSPPPPDVTTPPGTGSIAVEQPRAEKNKPAASASVSPSATPLRPRPITNINQSGF